MKELKIENSDRVALVDDEHYERLSKFKWYITNCKHGRVIVYRNYQKFTYRQIHISLANDVKQDYDHMFDHEDRDIFNNLNDNLRIATISQNNANQKKREIFWGNNTSSKFIGVYWFKRGSCWKSCVTKNSKKYYVGSFDDEIEAAVARDKKAIELHGEFASLNTVAIANRLSSGMIPGNCSITI